MGTKITITKPKEILLIKEYVLRGIRLYCSKKECFVEKRFGERPTEIEIATFLADTGAEFCSLIENYRIEEFLPFV